MLEPEQRPSPGEVLDTKLMEQERVTRELEARVLQLELIARARGQILPGRGTPRVERPDAPQAS